MLHIPTSALLLLCCVYLLFPIILKYLSFDPSPLLSLTHFPYILYPFISHWHFNEQGLAWSDSADDELDFKPLQTKTVVESSHNNQKKARKTTGISLDFIDATAWVRGWWATKPR